MGSKGPSLHPARRRSAWSRLTFLHELQRKDRNNEATECSTYHPGQLYAKINCCELSLHKPLLQRGSSDGPAGLPARRPPARRLQKCRFLLLGPVCTKCFCHPALLDLRVHGVAPRSAFHRISNKLFRFTSLKTSGCSPGSHEEPDTTLH